MGQSLVDEYGPTETNNFITSIKYSDKKDYSSIGHLNYNSKIYILDSEKRQVPYGAIGELHLAGYQVSKGYLNHDEKNHKSFIDNPFDNDKNYSKLYCTGDMVRMLSDGTLSILGRQDNQVKIRGNRVELSEVESTIRSIDYVKDVTIQIVNNNGNNELIAYIVTLNDLENKELLDSISNYVMECKPDYMIPSYVIKLDEIPLNINGKVDNHALPKVDLDSLHTEFVPPTTEEEKAIVYVFEEVFNQKGIGLYDDFIQLGGDSISAIRIVSLLQKRGIDCNARDILNYKTPYIIAQNINVFDQVSYDATEGNVDLLPIQDYFFDKINTNNYSQEFILKSKINMNLDILQKAFDELTNVHDMLRVKYRNDDGEIIQEIMPINTRTCKIKEYTIDNDFKNTIKDIIIGLNDSLDINGELIKINLIHHDGDSYLVFVIHHLIIDGVSWSILINDLTQIYTQMVKDNKISLLRPYPYKLWVNDVKQLVENIHECEKQHWIKINESIDESSIKGQSNPFNFNKDIKFDVNNLLRLSEEEYLALSIARAYKKTYGKNIIFNRETHGRDESIANVAGTLGWFTSKYPVLVDVSNDYDNISLASDVYSLKTAFKDVNHFGLNYASLIYTLKELKYKQCPVTFNFLSDEFIFENELFKSINHDLFKLDELYEFRQGSEFYGITLNVFNIGESYIFSGYYARNTYIGDEFDTFVKNIKKELDFIGNYKFDDGIVTCLSEPQIGIYLDEKVNDKGIAYSSNDILECNLDKSVNEIKQAIHSLIDKHPILKGRILDTADMPLLVCDSYPLIEVVDIDDYSELVKPFDLDMNLARFFIIDKPESKFIFYDLHHIISDASTRSIINKELNEAFENSLDDSIDLGFLYDSYDSFESKFESRYESAHEFFNVEFNDMGGVESLLDDIDGHNGSVSLFIPDVRECAEQFIRKNGISIGNLLNSVFAYTYSRFTGSNKVYYNFTEHGRHESYNQNAIGMFIRTIPIVVDCKDRQINDYVHEVSDLILESMANSIYPFRLLVREFGLNNDVTFEYNSTLNEIPNIDENIVFRDTANGVSEFLCVVNDYENGFIVNVSHLDKISQNTAERFVNVFKEILVQILDKKTLKEIDYTSDEDKRILNKYNRTECDLRYDDILDAFNYNLSKYPDNKLVSMEDRCYNYGEGAYIADKIAKQLIDFDVNRQDRVAFLLPRSEYYMFAVLGIMSMGGVYVPLDDKLPDKRIGFMLEDCDTKAIIVSDETCNRAENITDIKIVNISSIIEEKIESLNQLPVVYDDLACILYTSGTTGIPKGVKITRKAILNISEHYIDENNLCKNSVYGLYASIGFDAASKAICQTFYDGASLSIIPEDVRLDMHRLNDYFINQKITHTMMTTQVAKLFIHSIDKTSLKILKVGGEKLGEITNPSDYNVIDGYGPTETFAYITSIDNNDKLDYSSIGMLNYNTSAYVLDNEFRQVPYGAVGELYIAGYQVAKGYLNRDEETKYSFLENPFNNTKGHEVLYRSGDMVRFLPDGSLAIVGRRDNQVKIRGNRVELAEIESVIRELDFIDDVTVQTIENESNNELVAYVVVSDEIEDIWQYVCDYVGENKPGYMVPSFVVKIDSIPLTVNGKVDRLSLPEVEIDSLNVDYVAPKTEKEKDIVEAFQKVFNQKKISMYDDFIRLGGDSLTAIKLISYLKDYNITAGEILSLRTPNAISKNISKNQFNLDSYSLDSGCPLSESQLNVYLDVMVKDKINSYIIPLFMEISKEYGVNDIINALEEMFNIHPILGMHVSNDYDVPYLVRGSKPPIIVKSQHDDEFIKSYLVKPFDLNDNLCRFLIIENNKKYELFASFHHIIFDAISDKVFKRDLLTLLDGCSVAVDDSFLMVSSFSEQIKDTEEYENAKNFYKSMLDESDDVGILLDSVFPDGPGSIYVDLDLNSNVLKSFIKENQITKNALFTGVFAYTLSRFVANEQVLFNIVENGRDRFNNLNSIGMFVNTLPLLVNCENQDVSSFMRYMSQLIYDITKYNYYSYRLLANEFNFDSNIIFQFVPDLLYDAENVVEKDIDFENDFNFISDLNVNVIENGKKYNLNINYSNNYSSNFINAFAESYKLILHEITNVDKLSEIRYISNNDVKILDEYNKTDKYLSYDDILDAFNDNLAKCPDRGLVSFNENHYSYSEGAFIADKIAKRLINIGINKQDCVAFLLPRSEYYMFAVLGILSAGAVYVPLDENLPDKRMEFILEDTASKVIIVSDETFNRVGDMSKDLTVLNLSEIIDDGFGNLSFLPVTHSNLACILYTSGTTGLPKGVKITRKAILNLSAVYAENYDFTNVDVYGLFATIGFDAASQAICQTIYAGACLSIVPEDIKLNMSYLNDYFISQGVTHTMITTPVGRLFIKEIDETSLKVLTVGGEVLGEFESPNNYILADAYGPTENFAFICQSMVSDKIHPSSVGLLNYNTKAYILDKEGRRVPIGAVGELCVSGYQLANGYLNKKEETDKKFVKNPFDNSPKYNMIYHTGDLVRILPDGSLGIVGRRDRQVKIRGNRVELNAVESIIRELDYVEDVTVQSVKNNHNNELVAYVVLSREIPKFKESISNCISLNKPGYMVPSFIIELDEIPLTVNGKVNKRELPEVEWDELYRDYYGPTNKMEEIVINVFEEVFNYEGISLFDDFTILGGDSIIAIRIVSLLNEKSIYCNARDILKYKTPYLIAQNIGKQFEKISYDATEGEVELLPIQKYFFDYINQNKFTQNFILKMDGDIDVNKLQQALNELVNIHDMLRAVYRFEGNTPIQEILPLNARQYNINEYTIKDNLEENMINIFIDSLNSLDIHNKVIDASLIKYDDEYYFIIVVHHLIIDGVSWNILLGDLTQIYFNLVEGVKIDLLRPYPYKNWVNDVKQLVNNISDEEKQHWINVNNLLDDDMIKGDSRSFSFNAEIDYEANNLLMLSEDEYLALAIARAYKKTYGKDIIFNVESYGRDESLANVSRTIGWFTSQYPVSIKISNGYDNISLMEDVYNIKTAFKDIDNLGLNYSSLIYTTGELDFKHCPVSFNFLSSEFIFKNNLFTSMNYYLSNNDEIIDIDMDTESYGISFNISRIDNYYLFRGNYADGTYIGDEFKTFHENILSELKFIGNYSFKKEGIVCCLSEPQLGVYLDEKMNDKGISYSVLGVFECELSKSIDEIERGIHELIDKHPILKAHILDTGDRSLLICDAYPSIEVVNTDDYSKLVKPFDLNKSLARFYIIENSEGKFVFYDMHHIISDATSVTILNKELNCAINGELNRDVDYGFVYAGSESFESKFTDEYKSAYEFFKDMLTDIDDVAYLLEDVEGSAGSVTLPIRGIRDHIESFVKNKGVSLGSFLNSVFAYTYSRFTGGDKVYYNFTEHGRHENYSQDALGMFVRTVPIIIDCKDRFVDEYLYDASNLILSALTNSFYPFRVLSNDFNLNNKVTFEYNRNLNDVSDVGDDITFSNFTNCVSEFLCVVNDLEDGFLISVSHRDKFSQDTAERFVKVFKEVLMQFLEKENLRDINYISNNDIQLLNEYNQRHHDLTYNNVLNAFNDNLAKYPNNKLVYSENRTYSYGEGAYIANKIAEKLTELGVKAQDFVGFLVEKSEYYVFNILGILSIGAVFVPLDDNHPDERIKFMLTDTKSKVLIVSDETHERALNLSLDITLLNINDIFNENIESLASLPVTDGNLACILYTSGTTGIPKGVKITRKSIVNYLEGFNKIAKLKKNDVFAMFSSIGFDAGAIKSILLPIFTGSCLTIIPEDIRLNISKLNKFFMDNKVTYTSITTPVAKLFMKNVENTSLKVLTTGGEKLGQVNKSLDYLVIDGYGPTEGCVSVCAIEQSTRIDSSSVGHLYNNIKAYILDNEFRQVPVGAIGELYLSGIQIADGYLNRDEETEKAFLNNPFDDSEDYNVMYRTGDLVRLLPDGSLGIAGRRDNQVKVRGNRIELSEVESTIRTMDIIDDVTVQAVNNNGNNEIVAYVVVSNDLEENKLRELIHDYVANLKPNYMVPAYVIKLHFIPLNVNGKVDKKSLPEVDISSLRSKYVAPRNETEKYIIDAFEKVFNEEDISIYDDFINMGGDSLAAIQIVSLLAKKDIILNANTILTERTPYKIALHVTQNLNTKGFNLVKKGKINKNMFLIPAMDGLSIIFSDLIRNIDFEGNIYVIDDFRYELSLDEIKNTNHEDIFNYYYDEIKDLFCDGDIIVGYSLGCIYASLLVEKLEKDKKVDKCILIDGTLSFESNKKPNKEDIAKQTRDLYNNYDLNQNAEKLVDKVIEISYVNSTWNFHMPQINTHIIYLATSDTNKKSLKNISNNYEFIFIESNHQNIVTKDVGKIINYFECND
ncbi:non-ribosomal peptide synthetase [uncultured Methanobrevibacter sp.]|uniref:non-ribosomal peptide synthetase n=1 Tax=uncultured Methanobrevibacter sp. TaxID=253161 RepID=UPI0025EE0C11|nr:non-ribosomal peptide synthetase [uncultured Methanobrevibacter sp.]